MLLLVCLGKPVTRKSGAESSGPSVTSFLKMSIIQRPPVSLTSDRKARRKGYISMLTLPESNSELSTRGGIAAFAASTSRNAAVNSAARASRPGW
jgi:hypothetical protein